MKLIKKKIIFGCESRGDAQSPYLTRWTLLSSKLFAVYLHKFHRSDADEHHDHPWRFVSLILWRGYFEETVSPAAESVTGTVTEMEALVASDAEWHWGGYGVGDSAYAFRHFKRKKRVWPGMILIRPATWRHRVVLIDHKPAWTLIIRSKYIREWGFFTAKGWQQWREYFKERGC